MDERTLFQFVTNGIYAALTRATEAAGGKEIRVGGGGATVANIFARDLSMKCTWLFRRSFFGAGEHLLAGIDLTKLAIKCTEHVGTAKATHVA
jgi:dihydrofolate reductase